MYRVILSPRFFKDDHALRSLRSGTPSDLSVMLPLVPVVKILEKNWDQWENLGESGDRTFKGSD